MICPVCQAQNPNGSFTCSACGSPLTNPTMSGVLPLSATLEQGCYEIEGVLGQGGFGITYRGKDLRLNRAVAIKEFFPQGCVRSGADVQASGGWTLSTYTDAKQQFLHEGQALAQFNDPGIVQVYAAFEENQTAYIVMELLKGKTLGQRLEETGSPLPESEALSVIKRAGHALARVHQAHLLHRDLKPDNIVLAEDGRVVLIDFGSASDFQPGVTQSGDRVLTPGYAPLEQYASRAHRDATTDIYALAATLYHLLCGQPPAPATDRAAGVELTPLRRLNPRISEPVEEAVMRGLEMKVANRPQSVEEFLALLDGVLPQKSPGSPRIVPPSIPPPTLPKPAKSRFSKSVQYVVSLVYISILILVFTLFYAWVFMHPDSKSSTHRPGYLTPLKIVPTTIPKIPLPDAMTSPTAPPLPPEPLSVSTIEVQDRYDGWLQSWLHRDIDGYMAYYSPHARGSRAGGASYGVSNIRKKLRGSWASHFHIRLRIGPPTFTPKGKTVVLTVHQTFESANWREKGMKRLVWSCEGGNWKIMEDDFAPDG